MLEYSFYVKMFNEDGTYHHLDVLLQVLGHLLGKTLRVVVRQWCPVENLED